MDMRELSKVVGDTWRGLKPKDREHYESKARKETARYLSERRQFDDLQRMYTEMHSSAFHAGGHILPRTDQRQAHHQSHHAHSSFMLTQASCSPELHEHPKHKVAC